jgi:hypothetical protein
MTTFRKKENCPTSPLLLAFQRCEVTPRQSLGIMRHLSACEFCVSEVEFYSNFPPGEETVQAPEIPEPLFELAESLLKNDREGGSRIFRDIENL